MANDEDGKIDVPKEILVLIPLVGSAIAISYDVGYFYGIEINFFTLFSLAEHLLFALEAAPLALLMAVTLVAFFELRFDERLEQAGARHAATGNRWPLLVLPVAFVIIVGLLYMRWGGAAIAAGMIGAGVAIWLKAKRPKRWVVLLSIGSVVIVASFAAGYDTAVQYLQFAATAHTIQTDTPETLGVKLIRSGDRGVLYYEQKSKEVGFVKWGSIKKISKIW